MHMDNRTQEKNNYVVPGTEVIEVQMKNSLLDLSGGDYPSFEEDNI